MRTYLHHGEALRVLQGLPDASVDSMVTDPPSGIEFMSKGWDTDKGGRRRWIAWLARIMGEARRVLKPGSHVLVWALPRTSHWTATALEDAGFELIDSIHHVFGTGFPKSGDLSKKIDATLGAEREKVRHPPREGLMVGKTATRPWLEEAKKKGYHEVAGDEPATEEARRWQGWSSQLKPAHEVWWLARAPLAESSIARNVLEHGVGAINTGACRVGSEERVNPYTGSLGEVGFFQGTAGKPGSSTVKGRWPPNLLFTHSPDCREVGERKVKATVHDERSRLKQEGQGIGFFRGVTNKPGSHTTGDEDGMETVPVYECAPGCPVAELGRQSGESVTPESVTRGAGGSNGRYGPLGAQGRVSCQGDSGTAARFFPCFSYIPKPSPSERNAGCEGLEEREVGSLEGGEAGCEDDVSQRFRKKARNVHPTVKPIALMRWLCRLVTPPGGRVLDPFMGSGTTGCGAVLEGFSFVGVERSSEYLAIAKARIDYWKARAKPKKAPSTWRKKKAWQKRRT